MRGQGFLARAGPIGYIRRNPPGFRARRNPMPRIRTSLLPVALVAIPVLLGLGALVEVLRAPSSSPPRSPSRATLIDSGRVAFGTCALCHGREGRGDRCPPLAYSDFVQGDRARLIRFVLRPDTVRVNGVLWRSGEMPSLEHLSDFQVAAVLTYIRSLNDSSIACTPEDAMAGTWAECRTRARGAAEVAGDSITPAEVGSARAALAPR
jgi:mono/diheme cytochrome c family protein